MSDEAMGRDSGARWHHVARQTDTTQRPRGLRCFQLSLIFDDGRVMRAKGCWGLWQCDGIAAVGAAPWTGLAEATSGDLTTDGPSAAEQSWPCRARRVVDQRDSRCSTSCAQQTDGAAAAEGMLETDSSAQGTRRGATRQRARPVWFLQRCVCTAS
ncbi:hypothetical protein K505DRAFT_141507 [Melanomma pulvis-pyrius CBS 109.77]|uniref:Uncharacterized protein n=1 Tax=Melanomma pulvis-pyrius CBS 109.77 TaxID=1314802 RepID=A0A6A6WRP7_9PLEO|nr:hypothetical protein K505DRAFT_141507 [Melanomma pulvis-pyrius CBS 109.77]